MTKIKKSKRKKKTHKATKVVARKGAGKVSRGKGKGKRSTPAKSRARSASNNNGTDNRKVRAKTGDGPRVLIHARILPVLRDKLVGEFKKLGLPNISAMVERAVEKYFQ